MKSLVKIISAFVSMAALLGAGTASFSLFYQPPVPEKLQKKC